MKKYIRLFKFYDLTLSEFLELLRIIFEFTLPRALAKTLGLGRAYNETEESYDKLVDIFRRNPAMLQTEELVVTIAGIRRKMILFKGMLKDVLASATGEDIKKAKLLENLAHPYLKNAAHDTQAALAANAAEMADALRTAANLPALTSFGLKDFVDEIAALAHAVGQILYIRGEEKAFRKELGNATDTRKKLEKQLQFLLYSAIPVHYTEATGALLTAFEHAIVEINGTLDSFRHLTSGNGSDDPNSGSGDNNNGNGNEEDAGDDEEEVGGNEEEDNDDEFIPPPEWEDPDA
ncbi:MAG: DUF6261 family protein [Tannerellaceae bacterium]|jgi:hypothetical protein|nr:DUF6261 family protein [Tannerellaceae bacterium]